MVSEINNSIFKNLNESEKPVAIYKDKENDNEVRIVKSNNRFKNYYYSKDKEHWDSNAGPFDSQEDAEKMAKKHRPSTEKVNENVNSEKTLKIADKYGITDKINKLSNDLLAIDGVTNVEFDLDGYIDGMEGPITIIDYNEDISDDRTVLKNAYATFRKNGVVIEKAETEVYDTYMYFVSYGTNWNKNVNESEEMEDEEESDIYELVNEWDGNLANDPCDGYEWKEIAENAPDLFKQALEARESFVVTNFEWSNIPEQVWDILYELCDEGSIQGTPGEIIDNVIINGDYGDFDNYKNEDESDEEFISRVEDSVFSIYPEDRFVVFSL